MSRRSVIVDEFLAPKQMMVSCLGFSSRNSDARWRRNRQRQLARKVKAYSKVAANNDSAITSNKLCLRHLGMEDETERGDRFWNTKMKFLYGETMRKEGSFGRK